MRNRLNLLWLLCFWAMGVSAPAGAAAADNMRADPNLFIAGLPGTAVYLDGVALPDGSRHDQYLLPNWPAMIDIRRLPPFPSQPETLEQVVADKWPEANGLALADFGTLADATSFPAVRAEFETGANEDTMRHIGVFLFTDAWTFWIDIAASVDVCIDGVDDAVEAEERLRYEVDKILEGVKITDMPPDEGDAIVADAGNRASRKSPQNMAYPSDMQK